MAEKKAVVKNADQIKRISQLLFDHTQDWFKRNGLAEDEIKGSKKARQLSKLLLKHDFGCQKEGVKAILEVLINETIELPLKKDRDIEFEYGCVLVALSVKLRGPSGTVLITDKNGHYLDSTGYTSTDYSFAEETRDSYRAASLAEIENLMEVLFEKENFNLELLQMIFENIGEEEGEE